MKELNNSIYHEPGVGLLLRVEIDGAERFYTQQGLEALIEAEKFNFRDVSHLQTGLEDLVQANQDYQYALWDFLRTFAARVLERGCNASPNDGVWHETELVLESDESISV